MLTTPLHLTHPGDPGWDDARRGWNLAADLQPAAIAAAQSAEDVQAAVRHAVAHDLRLAVLATGHGAAHLGDLTATLLVTTGGMTGVTVDAEARCARVEAGAVWADVTAVAGEHGLAALAGTAPTVGVVGYTLGGGIGWLSRRHGLASNHVRAIELVTPAGDLVRATAAEHCDLFWALRGSRGGLGIVTAIELELFPCASAYAGMLTFPAERAPEVLAAWRDWAQDAPDAITSTARVMQLPPAPELPEPLRGRRLVVIDAADLRDDHTAAAHLAPLRELNPEIDTFDGLPIASLGHVHMDPPQPVPAVAEHALLDALPDDALAALVPAAIRGLDAGLLMLELRQLGGALSRPPAGAGALSHLDARFAVHAVAIGGAELTGAVDDALAALEPWATGWAYPNFAERGLAGRPAFSTADTRRLTAVKALHDPTNRIH